MAGTPGVSNLGALVHGNRRELDTNPLRLAKDLPRDGQKDISTEKLHVVGSRIITFQLRKSPMCLDKPTIPE